MQMRILEIDASPRIIPSEIEKMLGPILTRVQTQVEFKAGELPDADWPDSHSSYYVGVRYGSASSPDIAGIEKLVSEITQFCNSHGLPIIEVTPLRSEFGDLVAQLSLA